MSRKKRTHRKSRSKQPDRTADRRRTWVVPALLVGVIAIVAAVGTRWFDSPAGGQADQVDPDQVAQRVADVHAEEIKDGLTRPVADDVVGQPDNRSTDSDVPFSQPPGHQEMVQRLRQIAHVASETDIFTGTRILRQLRTQRENMPASLSSSDQAKVYFQLGLHEARLGHEQEAIESYTLARQLVSESDLDELSKAGELLEIDFRLGIANLRFAETQNCCLQHNSDACLLPIRGAGIHTRPEGSRHAIECFLRVLKVAQAGSREYVRAQWLANIAYMTLGMYPADVPPEYLIPLSAFQSEQEFPKFTNIAPQLGMETFSSAGGVIVDDLDNDGYLDILTSTMDATGQIRFFHNQQNGQFQERTDRAGLSGILGGLNLIHADYNNDGNLDVLVLRGAWLAGQGCVPNSLLRNNGDGTFSDVTLEAGLARVDYPTQTAAWADYDNDGDLDLYIGNETTGQIGDETVGQFGSEKTGQFEAPCQLFRNEGDGTFVDVAQSAGVTNLRWTKGVVWGDYDNDRFPDLYVTNLGHDNRLYRNNGDGTFSDVAARLGVTKPNLSFPTWFWDFNNDGNLDIYASYYDGPPAAVADVAVCYLGYPARIELACLYRGDGDGGFTEVARDYNLTRVHLPMGANFGDLDNDGYLDFYLGTGYPDYESLMPNIMYRNDQGRRFLDVTAAGGFGHLQKGHAIAFADLDNDGDQDVYEQMGGAFPGDKYKDALYENPGLANHWLTVQLVGAQSNRCAIGARIRLAFHENGQPRVVYKHVNTGGSFGSNPLRQTLGVGAAEKIDTLEILWPTSGITQRFVDVAVDRFIGIVEGKDAMEVISLKPIKLGGKQ